MLPVILLVGTSVMHLLFKGCFSMYGFPNEKMLATKQFHYQEAYAAQTFIKRDIFRKGYPLKPLQDAHGLVFTGNQVKE